MWAKGFLVATNQIFVQPFLAALCKKALSLGNKKKKTVKSVCSVVIPNNL